MQKTFEYISYVLNPTLFYSKKCYRRLRKWLNSETQEVNLKLKIFLYWFYQIGIKEPHTKFQVINFIFTAVMTFLIFSKFESTTRACPKILKLKTVCTEIVIILLFLLRKKVKYHNKHANKHVYIYIYIYIYIECTVS